MISECSISIRSILVFSTIIFAAFSANAQATAKFDFDGDGKTDIARWQPSTAQWKVKKSSNGSITTLTQGSSTTIIAPADYDGDGTTDYAGFNHSTGAWTIKRSSDGATQTISSFGQYGDKVVSGKYDADNLSDAAIYRPSNGTWYIKQSSNGTIVSTQFGAATDIPAPGDYDGDGKNDFAVFRPSVGGFYVMYSSTSQVVFLQWGISTDTPVCADYDADGKTDIAVFRPSTGVWHINKSNGNVYAWKVWGNYGDQPAPADYDGDAKADFAVWRPTTGVWYIVNSQHDTNSNFPEYSYEQFGAAGDVPVPSAFVKQIGSPVSPYGLAKARLAPRNRTGGTDLYSQNFGWGTSLVNLPGRAGLDAGFGISYNSLIWIKQFDTMIFDADNSNVSPGFRFGFPVIEPGYYDSQTGRFAYLMVTPSGARVEFRQDAASGVYETADSSYTQLTVTEPLSGGGHQSTAQDLTLTVTTTDGTRMTYEWRASQYHLSQIKDRNGNYITVNHDQYGLLRTVTDTLGRVINVNYDSQHYPISITQQWKDDNGKGTATTHTYATFTYTNSPAINTNFFNLATSNAIPVYGPPNGTVLKVLQKITFADGSNTTFDYNAYGQVQKISNYGNNQSSPLNYVQTNLSNPGAAQQDCPRLTETRSSVKDFNGGAETVVKNSYTENQTCYVAGLNLPTTRTEIWMEGHPNNLVSKTCHFAAGTWREGLPYATEDVADNQQKRWTVTAWTQDDTSLYYILNPRVGETKVGDGPNVKRTVIEYLLEDNTNRSIFGLVSAVKVYDANQTTLLKKSVTVYNRDAAYESRRIIGLPLMTQLEDGSGNPLAKTTYSYDGGDFSDTNLQQTIAPVQHDTANYGASFITGRGNLTLTLKDEIGGSATISSQVKYNTAGAPVAQIDPLGRTAKISYADSFNDGGNTRNTFAYPTKLTEAASPFTSNNFSTIQYRYDIGANVHAKSPLMAISASNLNGEGKETKRFFDAVGRLERESIIKNGAEYAYTRYDFSHSDSDVHSKVFSTVTDSNNSGAGDATDEILTEAWTDGAGRILKSRKPMKFGTSGNVLTWAGQKTEYDILGRATQQSVPAEVDANWDLAGDDATRGTWLWTRQKYDWKGRVTRKINTDGADSATPNASDILISYEGCGCAGGQETTIQGELVPRDDLPNSSARRTQKIYEDVLGRTWKTVEMKWDGTSPYKTTVTAFNGRDQATSVTETDHTNTNSVSQVTTLTYDGFGRLQTEHRPEQSAGTNTTYAYQADNQLHWMEDARGAKTTYAYNTRGLVESVSYSAPTNSNITVPATVSFTYDALGNRTKMEDGLGEVNYEYNQFSQITAETREFDDTLPNAPITGNKFRLEYGYGISGQLLFYKDPYGKQINYTQDKLGRLESVTGTVFDGVTTYANNPVYRAWGALKSLSYGNNGNTQMQMTYDNRLQAATYHLTNSNGSIMKKNYDYYADGNLKFVDDELKPIFDRLNIYDHTGRIKKARSAQEASGGTVGSVYGLPYRQDYAADAFGNMTQRTNLHWGYDSRGGQSFNLTYTFQNNRVTNAGWEHDADGRVTKTAAPDTEVKSVFDAAGNLITLHRSNNNSTNSYLDGDGRESKRARGTCPTVVAYQPCQQFGSDLETRYFIRSTVLGNQIISEVRHNGKKSRTYVIAAGTTLARQEVYDGNGGADFEEMYFNHEDATGLSQRTTYAGGYLIEEEDIEDAPAELDPLGSNVGITNPYIRPRASGGNANSTPKSGPRVPDFGEANFINGQQVTYTFNGMEISAQMFCSLMKHREFDLLRSAAREARTTQTGWKIKWTANGTTNTRIKGMDVSADYLQGHRDEGSEVTPVFGGRFLPPDYIWGTPFKVPREFMPLVTQISTGFLDKNPDCEEFINKLIEQMARNGNISLKGDIRAEIKNFEKEGFLTLFPVSSTTGGQIIPGGSTPPSPPMRIDLDFTNINDSNVILTFLHEMIHAIGARVNGTLPVAEQVHLFDGSWRNFSGDVEAAQAVYDMGLMKMSPQEYANLPENKERAKNETNPNVIPSNYWRGTLRYICGGRQGTKPSLMK